MAISEPRRGFRTVAAAICLAGAAGQGCDRPNEVRKAAPEAVAAPEPTVRVLLATMWAPSSGYERVRPFLDCLDASADPGGAGPGSSRLVQRGSYRETNALLAAGGADLALVCTGSAVDPALRAGFDAPWRLRFADGEDTYRGTLVVKADDPARSVEDLAGAPIAWVDPDSFTGCCLPRSRLRDQGIEPDRFFGEATFTYGHDRAIDAVRLGVVRVAAVDE